MDLREGRLDEGLTMSRARDIACAAGRLFKDSAEMIAAEDQARGSMSWVSPALDEAANRRRHAG